MKYEVYKTDNNRSIVVISKDIKKEQALTIANELFKTRIDALEIQTGRTLGEEDLIFPKKTGDVWVVFRRGNNDM